MNEFTERLKEKGWTDDDIQKAVSIIEQGKIKKPKKIAFLDSIVYWIVLLVALIGNFIISIILIPFMLTMQGIRLYTIIFIIGFAFGAFFDLLIRDIEKLQQKDVIIAGVFLPILAIINVSLMVKFSNFLQATIKINNVAQSPIIISSIYVVGFILPYLIRTALLLGRKTKNFQQKL